MPRKKTSRNAAKGPVQLERSTMLLLSLCGFFLLLWAGLASLAAYHFRTRLEVSHIKLEDAYESLSDFRQRKANDQQATREELVEAEILRKQVANMFDQLLSEKYKPQTTADLMRSYQKVYNQLSGETLDNKEMQLLLTRLREVLGVTGASPLEPTIPRDEKTPKPVKPAVVKPASPPAAKPAAKPKPDPAAVVQPAVPPPPPPKGQVRSTKYRYGITFPDAWQIRSESDGAGVMASSPRASFKDLYTGYVVVNAHQMQEATDLNIFFTQNMDQIKRSLADYRELNSGSMQLGNLPARYMRCRYMRVSTEFEAIYIMAVRGDLGYVVSFSTTAEKYPEFQNAFNKIAGSMVFF